MKLFEIKKQVHVSEFNKPTKYDWFYEYFITRSGSSMQSSYAKWKDKNPPGHPKAFIEYVKSNEIKLIYPGFKYNTEHIEETVRFENNKVVFYGTLTILPKMVKPPFEFSYIEDVFLNKNELVTIEDLPAWLPERFSAIDLSENRINSLSNIHKRIKSCEHLSVTINPIRKNILGILLIEGIQEVDYGIEKLNKKGKNAFDIVYSYIKRGEVGLKAIVKCQSELLDADLDDYAEL